MWQKSRKNIKFLFPGSHLALTISDNNKNIAYLYNYEISHTQETLSVIPFRNDDYVDVLMKDSTMLVVGVSSFFVLFFFQYHDKPNKIFSFPFGDILL